jgi:UDP-glucuronate 4-epimerase
MFKEKRIFITGIAGFVGYHLALFLKKRGEEVVGCDNFNDYYDPQLKEERKKNLLLKGIEVKAIDLLETANLEKSIFAFNTTHLVHLAAQAGVRYSLIAPQKYIDSNIQGFFNVLEIVRKRPEIVLTYASSSSVYGLNKKIPFEEEDPIGLPASLYGATKHSNELMAASYHHLYGIRATGLRFFTVYGPYGRPDMAYFSFTKAILEERPIDVYNFGDVFRDYTYIDDIIFGTAAAIDLEAPLEIFNLGNHRTESVLTLIATIEDFFNKKAVKNFLPMQAGDVYKTYADISKSAKILSFFPKTTLQEGMKKFLTWYASFYLQESLECSGNHFDNI